ncbi:MAG: GNAT family N-acetyltransferase [Candidatus Bathyarchaeota archaeon]|nr:GNAT family N-acetyltransferase [Candidatus Bathyarchaeota archaeon]
MAFLRDLYAETGGLENWLPTRFENNSRSMDPGIQLWFNADTLVGLVVPDSTLLYYVMVHPDYIELYSEMVTWLEAYSRSTWKGTLRVIEMDGETKRENVLQERGFTRDRVSGIFRVRNLSSPVPDFKLPEGFSVRSVTPDDFDELASCIRQVFGHGEWFNRDILLENSAASYYHPDLDLVAVDEEGKIASFCTFRLDPPTGLTELEPMGALAEYRNRGIGRALICEGFRRLKEYDPSMLFIGEAANTPPANRLYELTGFTERYDMIRWVKPL